MDWNDLAQSRLYVEHFFSNGKSYWKASGKHCELLVGRKVCAPRAASASAKDSRDYIEPSRPSSAECDSVRLLRPVLQLADATLTAQTERGDYKDQSGNEFSGVPWFSFQTKPDKGIEEDGDYCQH